MSQRDAIKRTGFSLYGMRHVQACCSALGQIFRQPIATFITLLVIGIALALPATLYVFLQNLQTVGVGLNSGNEISLYLQYDLKKPQVDQLIQQLSVRPDIVSVNYISPEQGLREFKQHAQMDEALALLDNNPLPGVIVVRPVAKLETGVALENLANQLKGLAGVDAVQIDMAWLKRLQALISIGKYLLYALAGLLGFGVFLITSHTIYLATQIARQEINLLQWIGATKAFIRRPFLYVGLLYGFLGGIVAWVLVQAVIWSIHKPITELVQSYGGQFVLQGMAFKATTYLLALSMLLGLLGAWLAVQRHMWFLSSKMSA